MLLVARKLDLKSPTRPTSSYETSTLRVKLGRIDFPGCALLTLTLLPLLIVLDIGGGKLAWSSPIIFGLVSIGVASGSVFVIVEGRSKEPIFPLHLLTNPAVITSYLLLLLQIASQMAVCWPKLYS